MLPETIGKGQGYSKAELQWEKFKASKPQDIIMAWLFGVFISLPAFLTVAQKCLQCAIKT